MSNSDPWRKAEAAARARITEPKASPSDVADRLLQAVNAVRANGPAPSVTSSFSSAAARAAWRIRQFELDAELAEAAGAYAVETGAAQDALAANISAALALPADEVVGWSDTSEAYADTDDSDGDGDAADDDSDASHEGDDDTDDDSDASHEGDDDTDGDE